MTFVANTTVDAGIQSGFLYFIIFIVNLVGIGTLVGYLFYSRRIEMPLKLLIESFQKIELEKLDFKVDYLLDDELGLLIQSVEKMSQCLKQYYEEESWSIRKDKTTRNFIVRKSLKKSFAWFVTVSLFLMLILFGITLGILQSLSDYIPFDNNFLGLGFLILYSVVSSIIASLTFYKRRLKKPINLLVNSANKLADNTLDFKINYPVEDEMGLLCHSIEKMRNALYENNIKMWRMTEERKEVNSAFSHDLRTPITVIKGYLDYLEAYFKQDNLNKEKINQTLSIMSKNMNRVEGYVEMMNTIQKLEDTPIVKKQIQVNEFLEIFIRNTENLAIQHEKRVQINHKVSNRLLLIDSNIVNRVLDNILTNAFTYGKEKVGIFIYSKKQHIYFQVKDDGFGFNNENMTDVFKPFYQGENTKGSFGLG